MTPASSSIRLALEARQIILGVEAMIRKLAPRRHGLTLALLLALLLRATPLAALDTSAQEAILIDMTTGSVLLEKNADRPIPPASMSKIMTIYMVFKRLKEGRLSLDDKLPVSEKAWRKGGSKMFVMVNDSVPVEDLLRGVVIQSGNDASIVLAEGLGGTEEAFAEEATRVAHELGMTNSTFRNATGWPDPEHRTTVRDLATLAMHTIRDFPEFYPYYKETEFTWNEIRQGNRNPLLYKSLGVDGLKTGHTEEAGYCLTASAERGGQRLILVVAGLASVQARSEESARLIEWGFREFQTYRLFEPDEVIEEAAVWQGEEGKVPLVMPEGLKVTLMRNARPDLKVTVRYTSPIPAPIEQGQEIATLVVEAGGDTSPASYPLRAGQAVGRQGPVGRLFSSLKFIILGGP